MHGPQREGEESNGAHGPARRKGKWAETIGIGRFLIYSSKFEISLNCSEQKADLPSPKISN
jgi:hypothetical protein